MPLDRELIRQIRQLDEYDLRRLMIFVRGLLLNDDTPAEQVVAAQRRAPAVSYRQELVRCGRAGCRRCPHGPYWYAYWREDGRMRSRYIGKDLTGATRLVDGSGRSPRPEGGPPKPPSVTPAS